MKKKKKNIGYASSKTKSNQELVKTWFDEFLF